MVAFAVGSRLRNVQRSCVKCHEEDSVWEHQKTFSPLRQCHTELRRQVCQNATTDGNVEGVLFVPCLHRGKSVCYESMAPYFGRHGAKVNPGPVGLLRFQVLVPAWRTWLFGSVWTLPEWSAWQRHWPRYQCCVSFTAAIWCSTQAVWRSHFPFSAAHWPAESTWHQIHRSSDVKLHWALSSDVTKIAGKETIINWTKQPVPLSLDGTTTGQCTWLATYMKFIRLDPLSVGQHQKSERFSVKLPDVVAICTREAWTEWTKTLEINTLA